MPKKDDAIATILRGANKQQTSRLIKAMTLFMRAECPREWLLGPVDKMAEAGVTVEEAIAMTALFCQVANIKFENNELLKLTLERTHGKVALTVRHTRGTDEPDDLEGMNDEQLLEYMREIDSRKRRVLTGEIVEPKTGPEKVGAPGDRPAATTGGADPGEEETPE